MKRIVFITNSIGFGGAEKMLTFIVNSLADRGHNCAIINLNNVPDYVNEGQQKINDNVKLYNVVTDKTGIKKRLENLRQIKAIAKEFKAEIIIGFTGFPNMYASIIGKLLHIPSIMSERGDPFITWSKSWADKILLYFINNSKGGVFQTEGAMAYYGKGLQKRGKVIPNPIFLKGAVPVVPYEKKEKTIVSVGRFDNQQKRLDVMLNAFSIFLKSHPEYILKLYGAGTDEAIIRQWCNELGIESDVKFMGLTTQPMVDIAGDGMFLITSDYEGISNALLEAMAVGLPCVSTDHSPGGARLLITHGENGLLAPIGDAEGLAKCMCEFAENPELAKKCGENAKDVVNRFNPEKIIDMWENYIEQIN